MKWKSTTKNLVKRNVSIWGSCPWPSQGKSNWEEELKFYLRMTLFGLLGSSYIRIDLLGSSYLVRVQIQDLLEILVSLHPSFSPCYPSSSRKATVDVISCWVKRGGLCKTKIKPPITHTWRTIFIPLHSLLAGWLTGILSHQQSSTRTEQCHLQNLAVGSMVSLC